MDTAVTLEEPIAAEAIVGEADRKGVRPKFTHCDICNEPLPEDELRMQAVNHRECWKSWVEEKRTREPELVED